MSQPNGEPSNGPGEAPSVPSPAAPEAPNSATYPCPRCGQEMPAASGNCSQCGARVVNGQLDSFKPVGLWIILTGILLLGAAGVIFFLTCLDSVGRSGNYSAWLTFCLGLAVLGFVLMVVGFVVAIVRLVLHARSR